MNTPVSFELAKLLKEKGFDEPTKVWHQRGNGVVGCVEGERDFFNRKGDVYTSAPTIAEVVMWLYEKHGLHIEILLAEDNPWDKFYYRILKVGQYFSLSHDGTYRDSPTEAYEAAIDYTLKNLI